MASIHAVSATSLQEVLQHRDRPFLHLYRAHEHQTLTSGDLAKRIADYQSAYTREALPDGSTVLIILKESLDLFASFVAAWQLGLVPAYFAYPSPKQSHERFVAALRDLIAYNQIDAAVVMPEVRDQVQAEIPNVKCLQPSEVPTTDSAIRFEPSRGFLQFSSGTTGAKKGVFIGTEALANQINAYAPTLDLDEESVIVSWLPHYHDMGLIACMLMPLLLGVPMVMMSPFEWVANPAMLLRAITTFKGTHTWQPNFALGLLTKAIPDAALSEIDLSTLKRLVSCSEPVLPQTIDRFSKRYQSFGLRPEVLWNCYAMAENTFAMTTGPITADSVLSIDYTRFREEQVAVEAAHGYRVCSAGQPLPNLKLRIGDTQTEGVVGEVLIQSDCQLLSYHNNPEATKAAMQDGWFRTGDLGFLRNGELFVTGRLKEMIIVGGENIYPQDIEQILNDTDGFLPGRNVVFGVVDPELGTESIIALAEGKDVPDNAISQVRSEVLSRLNIAISALHVLPPRTLIKSTAGKTSRHLNKEAYLAGQFDAHLVSRGASGNPVLSLLSEIAGRPIDVSENDDLFELGILSSFNLNVLAVELSKAYAFDIPQELISAPAFRTLNHIKQLISRLEKGDLQARDVSAERNASLAALQQGFSVVAKMTPREWLINRFPFPKSRMFIWLLRAVGIRVGRGVKITGKIFVKIRGKAANIRIGDGVILSKGVDLRNRENGIIDLGPKVYLDEDVRLVAARDGGIFLEEGVQFGKGTQANSGGKTHIGAYTLLAGDCRLNSSTHGIARDQFIVAQAHEHGFITLGRDCWLGAGASVIMNTTLGEGVIVSGNSLVSGAVPDFAIVAGVPAQVIGYRP